MTATGPQDPPWWASVADDVDPDEDPLTAHRSARAGRRRDGEPAEDHAGEREGEGHAAHAGAPWSDLAEIAIRLAKDAARALGDRERGRATANASAPREPWEEPAGEPRHGDTCQYHCPVCAGLRALEEVRPELVTHLSEAARHVTLAARAFVDAQADRYASADGFERIDLDDEV